ncbi:MAG: thermonuclease family protein [Patescibacteria group bacterium]|jgi:endonuclease YncB( thermonuclease family)
MKNNISNLVRMLWFKRGDSQFIKLIKLICWALVIIAAAYPTTQADIVVQYLLCLTIIFMLAWSLFKHFKRAWISVLIVIIGVGAVTFVSEKYLNKIGDLASYRLLYPQNNRNTASKQLIVKILSEQTSTKIDQVVDGDTVVIDVNGSKISVRLIGMDTPEVLDPRKPVQCFGREASDKGKELLSHQTVRLEYDPIEGDWDKYDRLLRYVFLPDGTLYNEWMIANGYAHEYTYFSQKYKYQSQFKSAQSDAKSKQLGFWSPSTCSGNTTQSQK